MPHIDKKIRLHRICADGFLLKRLDFFNLPYFDCERRILQKSSNIFFKTLDKAGKDMV